MKYKIEQFKDDVPFNVISVSDGKYDGVSYRFNKFLLSLDKENNLQISYDYIIMNNPQEISIDFSEFDQIVSNDLESLVKKYGNSIINEYNHRFSNSTESPTQGRLHS